MSEVGAAIAHTPLWVFPLILIVLWLGARNLKTRERAIASLFLLPVVMLGLALANLAAHAGALALSVPAFLVSFIIGIGAGWNLVPKEVTADRGRGVVRVPGSVAPLLVVIAIVVLRYAAGYTYGRWPELRADPALALEFSATGALLAGIVWGRILRIGWLYRKGI